MTRADFRDITEAIYAAISGPPGPRNYDRIRKYYTADARLIRTGIGADGKPFAKSMTVDEHEKDVSALLADMAFEEVEIAHEAEIFGNVARVRSVYRSVYGSGPKARHGRGINYMNLVFDGRDWKVASVVWDNEREGLAIPPRVLRPQPDSRP